jgi:hypothetical protein
MSIVLLELVGWYWLTLVLEDVLKNLRDGGRVS